MIAFEFLQDLVSERLCTLLHPGFIFLYMKYENIFLCFACLYCGKGGGGDWNLTSTFLSPTDFFS
jgi:hypothetical protein